ncbi:MAG: BREX-3 system P-loop-containing protein BrxF [Deltaproteobacteria bacterium]|nr:BREX-3 system P-loop-containing protein BrxF [Deltaproteobacteria bacterium]
MKDHQNIFKGINYTLAIDHAAACYYKLALLVARSGSGKTNLLKKICGQMQIPLINLGISLSQKLLPLTSRERKLKTCEIISEIIDAQDAPRLAIDNTEIIFDPSLMLNPLGLLQSLSRTRLLIWSWNGELEDGHVTYAYPGHPECRLIPTSEITLITL